MGSVVGSSCLREALNDDFECLVQLLLVLLGALGTSGDQVDHAESESVDALLEDAKDGSNGSSERGAGDDAGAADDGLEELDVDADKVTESLANLLLAFLGEGVLELGVADGGDVRDDGGDNVAKVVDQALRSIELAFSAQQRKGRSKTVTSRACPCWISDSTKEQEMYDLTYGDGGEQVSRVQRGGNVEGVGGQISDGSDTGLDGLGGEAALELGVFHARVIATLSVDDAREGRESESEELELHDCGED